MAKQVSFSNGTIVSSEFLNDTQDLQTGAIWGVLLGAHATDANKLAVSIGNDELSAPALISDGSSYLVGLVTGTVNSPAISESSGDYNVYLETTTGTDPTVTLKLGGTPLDFSRKIGEVTWDGSALTNVKLTNGVFADANQRNSFTFRTIRNVAADTPLRLRGWQGQNTTAGKMLSVGHDDGSDVYQEKWYLSPLGRVTATLAADTTEHYRTFVSGDSVARFSVDAAGKISLGSGSGAADATIERSAAGVIKIGTTVDAVTLINSTGSGDHAGSVNINDDLNLHSGKVIRIAGTQITTAALSNSANIALLDANQTFTGNLTLSGTNSFSGVLSGTGANGYVNRVGAASGNTAVAASVSGDAGIRFSALVTGQMDWGNGTDAQDVSLARSGVGILTVTGKMQATGSATTGNDLTNKTYTDATYVALTGNQTVAGTKTFSSGIALSTAAGVVSALTSGATVAFSTKPAASTDPHFSVTAAGTISLGNGTSANDVTIAWSAANIIALGSGDKIQQNAAPTTGDDLTNKTYTDATYVALAGSQSVTGLKTFSAGISLTGTTGFERTTALTTDLGIAVKNTGDTQRRMQVTGAGTISWGSGSGAVDTNLYRDSANTLKTDDSLVVAATLSYGARNVSLVSANTTLGAITEDVVCLETASIAGSNINVTAPAGAAIGKSYLFADVDGSANTKTVTVKVPTGEVLNGVTDGTYVINIPYESVQIVKLTANKWVTF